MTELLAAGMGTGRHETLTLGVLEAAKQAERLVLQTGKVETAEYLAEIGLSFETLDALYDESEDFDDFNEKAAAFLLLKDAVFLTLGQPSDNEALRLAVEIEPSLELKVMGGLSVESEAAALAKMKMNAGMRLYDAEEFLNTRFQANDAILISAIDDAYTASEVILKLKRWYKPETEVAVINCSECRYMPLEEAENAFLYGYNCCLAIDKKTLYDKECFSYEDLKQVLIMLRDDFDGCPWDREQTHESLRRYLIEEAFEASEAIDRDDMFALSDELGDVLLQIMFHAQIADEMQDFDEYDICTEICKKMMHRHPHIFLGGSGEGFAPENWEEIKKKEKNIHSLAEALEDIPKAMDVLLRAEKLITRSAKYGKEFTYLAESFMACKTEEEAGNMLMGAVHALIKNGFCAEASLASACGRYLESVKNERNE
ncbi:MAG: hypothetical protein J6D00_02375 [Christensenellaceae bacterium]|nr:hypothetical protein [Christensenellaceae bacterium]